MNSPVFAAAGLIFDLDGTLVDSVPDIGAAANVMLRALGCAAVTEEQVRSWVGNGAAKLVQRALTGNMDGEPDSMLCERALPLFFDAYQRNVYVRSNVYPGVVATLDRFFADGFNMACVTNKPARHTGQVLEQAGLADFFCSIVAGDDLDVKKPDPGQLLFACEQMGLPPRECLMIGDSVSDVGAARAANIPVICMTYGYNQGLDPATLAADVSIDAFADLIALVKYTRITRNPVLADKG